MTTSNPAIPRADRDPEHLKDQIRQKYERIAKGEVSSCCGPDSCDSPATSGDVEAEGDTLYMGESYDGADGYEAAADLGLGCGLPERDGSSFLVT